MFVLLTFKFLILSTFFSPGPFFRSHPHPLFFLAHLGRERIAEVLGLEDLADLYLAVFGMRVRAAPDPFDRLFLRLHLPDPEARDQLFGLGNRAVDYGPFAAGKPDPRTFGSRLQ